MTVDAFVEELKLWIMNIFLNGGATRKVFRKIVKIKPLSNLSRKNTIHILLLPLIKLS